MRAHDPMLRAVFAVAFCVVSLSGCGGDDDEGDDGAPAAPTNLNVEELSGGAHLTWTDNSDNETEFMIMRMNVTEGGDYEELATPTFDTTQYHDDGIAPAVTYMYMVHALNDNGTSAASNEVEFTAP